jgi:hypothetical protein
MFQITIIDPNRSRVIDAPVKLSLLLREYGYTDFIPTSTIDEIKLLFPSVVIATLSSKNEYKKYKASRTIKNKKYKPTESVDYMIKFIEQHGLQDKDREFIEHTKDYLYETGGLGKQHFYNLDRMYGKYARLYNGLAG